jgi:hypothetical protein
VGLEGRTLMVGPLRLSHPTPCCLWAPRHPGGERSGGEPKLPPRHEGHKEAKNEPARTPRTPILTIPIVSSLVSLCPLW